MELTVDLEDLASYDTGIKVNGGGYILEAGEYILSLRSDSHTVLEETSITVDSDVVYNESNLHNGDQAAAVNRFDFARGDVTYLSRANSKMQKSRQTTKERQRIAMTNLTKLQNLVDRWSANRIRYATTFCTLMCRDLFCMINWNGYRIFSRFTKVLKSSII